MYIFDNFKYIVLKDKKVKLFDKIYIFKFKFILLNALRLLFNNCNNKITLEHVSYNKI